MCIRSGQTNGKTSQHSQKMAHLWTDSGLETPTLSEDGSSLDILGVGNTNTVRSWIIFGQTQAWKHQHCQKMAHLWTDSVLETPTLSEDGSSLDRIGVRNTNTVRSWIIFGQTQAWRHQHCQKMAHLWTESGLETPTLSEVGLSLDRLRVGNTNTVRSWIIFGQTQAWKHQHCQKMAHLWTDSVLETPTLSEDGSSLDRIGVRNTNTVRSWIIFGQTQAWRHQHCQKMAHLWTESGLETPTLSEVGLSLDRLRVGNTNTVRSWIIFGQTQAWKHQHCQKMAHLWTDLGMETSTLSEVGPFLYRLGHRNINIVRSRWRFKQRSRVSTKII
jgi:uncharacterized protein (DUF779 family)